MGNKSNISVGTKVAYCHDTASPFGFHPAPGAIGEITNIDSDGDFWVKWNKPLPLHPDRDDACYNPSWVRPISMGGF